MNELHIPVDHCWSEVYVNLVSRNKLVNMTLTEFWTVLGPKQDMLFDYDPLLERMMKLTATDNSRSQLCFYFWGGGVANKSFQCIQTKNHPIILNANPLSRVASFSYGAIDQTFNPLSIYTS